MANENKILDAKAEQLLLSAVNKQLEVEIENIVKTEGNKLSVEDAIKKSIKISVDHIIEYLEVTIKSEYEQSRQS